LSEQNLINGWHGAAGVRVRQARAADLPTIAELVPLAGVRLEDLLGDAVTADTAGAALRSGLRVGAGPFTGIGPSSSPATSTIRCRPTCTPRSCWSPSTATAGSSAR
jgi:hypothetical protein